MVLTPQLLRLRPQSRLGVYFRNYHSRDHSPPPGPFTSIETAILSAAIPHISSHGFTHTALALGAKDAGYLDASTNLFSQGAFSLVHYHLVSKRLALATLQETEMPTSKTKRPLDINAKVKALTWLRLMENISTIHRWQEALALMAIPSNMTTSLRELASLADEIWFLSGDTSVDTTWYTKRASLSSIYAATDLFMTTDKSPGFVDTEDFLDRLFQDKQKLDLAVSSLGQWVGFNAGAAVNVLRSRGARI